MIAPNRVVLSELTTSVLRSMTTKTGLSANIVARFAMLISLEEKDPPALDGGKPGLTINRGTLFGDLEPFLMSAYALSKGNAPLTNPAREIASHIARGAAYLNLRVNSVTDLLELVHDLS